ncbi:PTS glucitol/sorbitol transporter subunit IIA [Kocuria sp. M1R5S2]|uniref:PTS glucitol/sorbitol transporter subunit IIA n=1 Tax=Kocuria rhizosphaerae TaxID=3376285 RepID=UPI00379CFF97
MNPTRTVNHAERNDMTTQMNDIIYDSEVSTVGEEAASMVEGGVLIFFADPCPAALAEVSVVHKPSGPASRDPRPGDVLQLGEKSVRITKMGDIAASNLRELGHVVVYMDPAENMKLLPGAIHAQGTLDLPRPGARFTIHTGSAE